MKTKILTTLVCAGLCLCGCKEKQSEENLVKKALQIHEKVLTVDTHTDTPMGLKDEGFDIAKKNDPYKGGSKVDFPRMKEGGMDAMFFAAFIWQDVRNPKNNQKAIDKTFRIINDIHEVVGKNKNVAEVAVTSDDAYRIEKEGKRAIYIGIENGFAIGNRIELVKEFYDLGARYITLSHTKNNDICDSSTDKPEHNGLSEFGKKVVEEMNRLGMIIDVSHISDKSFYDVLGLSKTPVIASHSCARTICDNPRNLTDDMLKKLAQNGGVIQMCILSAYVKTPEPNPQRDSAFAALRKKFKGFKNLTEDERVQARVEWQATNKKYPQKLATVKDVVDHIDHIVKVAGIDHVGIGTDFDGGGGVADCFDVSQMANITIELVKRGYTEEQIEKIWSGNFMRVFREIEKAKES
ncbi:MAG: dipeptidase [Rhodothermaceae bacterium]